MEWDVIGVGKLFFSFRGSLNSVYKFTVELVYLMDLHKCSFLAPSFPNFQSRLLSEWKSSPLVDCWELLPQVLQFDCLGVAYTTIISKNKNMVPYMEWPIFDSNK